MNTEKCTYKKVFSAEEKAGLATKMAEAFAENERLIDEFDTIKKDYKMRIDREMLTAKICGEKHRNGYEMLTVDAEKRIDYTGKKVTLTHQVTGEILLTRDASGAELQMEFDDLAA